ncbi:hypothetical protein HBI24_095600 [Parastagonospora nodorum]|nr:hypothetical protein HBI24_095600 [Parastagonospora nodorum]KAH5814285.1 hypothetical protein HBI96_070740 [Parastagonospora nodorum]KAH5828420.1 hypothetical protein HBI94_055160 [Parastagonospora nodorum]KAH5866531.1 hypothetical protein HBI92_190720 [Parastagonospora nodorum]KAH5909980.1 hypothetical protein HBI89_070360 [Parastagonospora nodorum]
MLHVHGAWALGQKQIELRVCINDISPCWFPYKASPKDTLSTPWREPLLPNTILPPLRILRAGRSDAGPAGSRTRGTPGGDGDSSDS